MEWKKMNEEKPKSSELILVTNCNYAELAYIENNKLLKPWRYDKDDTTILQLTNVIYWAYIDIPAQGKETL